MLVELEAFEEASWDLLRVRGKRQRHQCQAWRPGTGRRGALVGIVEWVGYGRIPGRGRLKMAGVEEGGVGEEAVLQGKRTCHFQVASRRLAEEGWCYCGWKPSRDGGNPIIGGRD